MDSHSYGRTRCPRREIGGVWSIIYGVCQCDWHSDWAQRQLVSIESTSTARGGLSPAGSRGDSGGGGARERLGGLREVRDGEKRVLVEDLAVQEPLKEVPRHWCLEALGKLSGSGGWLGAGGGRGRGRGLDLGVGLSGVPRSRHLCPEAMLRDMVRVWMRSRWSKGVERGASEYKPRARIASYVFDIKVW